MPKIYIPEMPVIDVSDKVLFGLTRPFRYEGGWCNNAAQLNKWELDEMNISFTAEIQNAVICLLPYPVNLYVSNGHVDALRDLDVKCGKAGIKAYGFIDGDSGKRYKEFNNIKYFRAGGMRSQLPEIYSGFPVMIPDQLRILYDRSFIFERSFAEKPVIGFCGHASKNLSKRVRESAAHLIENVKRAAANPFRSDWEPIFPSAYHRSLILAYIERASILATNFIYRKEYRAGYTSAQERDKTTREYFENMKNSDYVLCVRGGGNFSVRFYEALMMGRIPVLVNTDCMLPFDRQIDWEDHIINIAWKDREQIARKVLDFHRGLGPEGFAAIQVRNRRLWADRFSIKGILKMLLDDNQEK